MRWAPIHTAVSIGLDTLRANPLRSLLSTLGVIIGVGSLVAVLSVGDGMEAAMREQIASTTDLQAISVQPRVSEEVDGQTFPVRNPMAFTPEDVRALVSLEGVDAARFVLRGGAEVRAPNGVTRRMAAVLFELVIPDSSPRVVAGRALLPFDREPDPAVVVVSYDLALDLDSARRAESLAGQRILIEGRSATVVGILEPTRAKGASPPPGGRGPARRDYRILAPYGLARAVLLPNDRDRAGVVLHAHRLEDTPAVRSRVEAWLRARDPDWARRATVQTYERRLEQAATGILTFKLFMGAITGISLLVGGIGIMNVLLSSVSERTREIGIRKATGARNGDIRLQFLAESVTITSAGSAVGLLLGVGGAFGITAAIRHFARTPFLQASLSFSTLVVAVVAAITVGLVFGTYPARLAARLSPVDAMRHE